MALFKRKQQPTTQIPELQEYYATQKSESKFVAWLVAIGSLLVTVAIFVGLFMGGRWLYRTITNKDKSNTTTTQTTDQTNSNNTSTSTNNNATISGGTVTVDGSSATSTSKTTPAPGVSPTQSAQTNQSAVAANTNLPNSGPGSVAVLFLLTTIAGSVIYRRILIKR